MEVRTTNELLKALEDLPSYWDKVCLNLCATDTFYVTPFEDHIDITLYAQNSNSIGMSYVMDLIDYLRKNTRDVKVCTAFHWTEPVEVYRVSNKMFWGETISHVTIR